MAARPSCSTMKKFRGDQANDQVKNNVNYEECLSGAVCSGFWKDIDIGLASR